MEKGKYKIGKKLGLVIALILACALSILILILCMSDDITRHIDPNSSSKGDSESEEKMYCPTYETLVKALEPLGKGVIVHSAGMVMRNGTTMCTNVATYNLTPEEFRCGKRTFYYTPYFPELVSCETEFDFPNCIEDCEHFEKLYLSEGGFTLPL